MSKTVKISELPEGTTLEGFYTIGTKEIDGVDTSLKMNLGFVQTETEKAVGRLNTLCDNRDKVVEGYWWHYNESTKSYENTGEIAKGNVMYATFNVTDEAKLTMITDEEYTGAAFALDDNGVLTVTI